MEIEHTPISGLIILTPIVFKDDRGYFFESFNQRSWKKTGINDTFVQDNQSYSTYGTIRGLHMQTGTHAQSKLVRVIVGEVFDVAVDLRPESPTFGKYYGVHLSGENNKQFYIPRGFAHGFSVLSKEAIFSYKCDNFYNKESEVGLIYNDKDLSIDWKVDECNLSGKDLILPTLREYKENLKL